MEMFDNVKWQDVSISNKMVLGSKALPGQIHFLVFR